MKINVLTSFLNQAKTTFDEIKGKGGRAVRQADKLEQSFAEFMNGLSSLKKDNSVLTIGIVGQMKAGKSTFLNALMFDGAEVLPTAATPMTAGLTILEYTDSIESQRFEVEYYTKKEWDYIKDRHKVVEQIKNKILEEDPTLASRSKQKNLEDKIKSKCKVEDFACYELKSKATAEACLKIGTPSDIKKFIQACKLNNILEDYVGANGKFTSTVKALHIYLNNSALTYENPITGIVESYKIVDTPGVNDPIVSRQALTEKFLQEAHAVLMLTRADTVLPEDDINFMNSKISKEGVSQILLVANKFDLLFATDSKCPNKLDDAIDYGLEHIESQFEGKRGLLNRQPFALCCTAGIAECLRFKLLKDFSNPVLNDEEELVLNFLRNKFPDDFCDEESVLESLDKIADYPTIMKDYIQGRFLENKNSIIEGKIADFIDCHRDAITNDFKLIIEEVDKELELAKNCDISTIVSQIASLEELKKIAIPKMQTRIIQFSKGLKEHHVKKLFETKEELLQYKPTLIENYSDSKIISYTRLSTFWERTKSGSVRVDVINPSWITKNEDEQIDKLSDQTNKRWTKIYNAEEDSLKKELLDRIKELANKDPSLNINVAVYEVIIMRCITDELCGKSQLSLVDKCSEQKREIAKYVNDSEHTDFNRSFGEMDEDDANERIKKQAKEKLAVFSDGMSLRNNAVYKELRTTVESHCGSINTIMTNFANNLTNRIEEQLNTIRVEKENSRKSIDSICKDIEERKNKFNELLNTFKQL